MAPLARTNAVLPVILWVALLLRVTDARFDFGLAPLDGKLYAVGGECGKLWRPCGDLVSGTLASVKVFDPATKNWTAGPMLRTTRGGFGLAALNGKLYAVGGVHQTAVGGDKDLTSLEILEPAAANGWIKGPALLIAREAFGMAALNEKLYVVGGLTDRPGAERSMEVLDLATERLTTWVPGPPMKSGRWSFGFAPFDGKLYAVGGDEMNSVEVFDPVVNRWTAGPPMKTARPVGWTDFGLAPFGGSLYAVGGWADADSQGSASVEVLSLGANGWQMGPSLRTGRFSHGLAALGTMLYAAGGLNGPEGETMVASVEVLESGAKQWANLEAEGSLDGAVNVAATVSQETDNITTPLLVV